MDSEIHRLIARLRDDIREQGAYAFRPGEYVRADDPRFRVWDQGRFTRRITEDPNVIEGVCWESTPEEVARGNSTPKPPVAHPERPADPYPYWAAARRPTVDLRRFQTEGLFTPKIKSPLYNPKGA